MVESGQRIASFRRQGRRTGEVIPRARASALNSSAVGVEAPVQTVAEMDRPHQDTEYTNEGLRTVNNVLLGLADPLSDLGVRQS